MENRVLILAPRGRDAEVIKEVLFRDGLTCVICRDMTSLRMGLEKGAGTALVVEEAVGGTQLSLLREWLDAQPSWSDFPFIMLVTKRRSQHAGDAVEQLGNVVVLERPLHAETLKRAVSSSLRARLRQYEARRQLAERIEEQERLHLALSAGRLGSWELDIDTGELRTTAAFRKLFGCFEPTLSYAEVLAAVHPDDRERRQQCLDQCTANDIDLTVEYRITWPDGSLHWIESRGHPARSEDGKAVRISGVSLDVTERHAVNEKILAGQNALEQLNDTLESRIGERTKELASANDQLMKEIHERAKVQAALVQAQKMEALGQLTGGIAHDFNNLLNVIMGNADFIVRLSTDERIQKMARTAKRASERGAKLTAQLLTFSRSSNLDLKPIEVVSLLDGMRDMLVLSMGNGLQLEIRCDVEEVWTHVDANQLELAVLNLAINGRDAMAGKGVLVINVALEDAPDETVAPGRYVVIKVTDAGTGIPADILPRVFDPFFTTKPVGKGTGLGLSQVYGIARQVNGTARIKSTAEQGTTVEIWLPQQEKPAHVDELARIDDEHASIRARVLVIEDDVDVRAFLVECLKMLGYDVIEAAEGRAGLQYLVSDTPDLLIVDFAMPGMNGFEVISQARVTHPELPMILATGYADLDVANMAIHRCTILRKPFHVSDLAYTVKAALLASEKQLSEPAEPPSRLANAR